MDEKIKVTDKRMFTAEGELRETVPDPGESSASDSQGSRPADGASNAPVEAAGTVGAAAGDDDPRDKAPRERADSGQGVRKGDLPAPTFVDLIGLLAQPIAMFLGDVELPGGETEENLPLARFHIDLLELVEAKTKGNISSEEAKLVEDLLYQLRMRYLEKAG